MVRSILSSAAEAFAGVFGFLSPLMGPFAAGPAAAAQATVASMASSVASADIGMWQVPQDMLTLVHLDKPKRSLRHNCVRPRYWVSIQQPFRDAGGSIVQGVMPLSYAYTPLAPVKYNLSPTSATALGVPRSALRERLRVCLRGEIHDRRRDLPGPPLSDSHCRQAPASRCPGLACCRTSASFPPPARSTSSTFSDLIGRIGEDPDALHVRVPYLLTRC